MHRFAQGVDGMEEHKVPLEVNHSHSPPHQLKTCYCLSNRSLQMVSQLLLLSLTLSCFVQVCVFVGRQGNPVRGSSIFLLCVSCILLHNIIYGCVSGRFFCDNIVTVFPNVSNFVFPLMHFLLH